MEEIKLPYYLSIAICFRKAYVDITFSRWDIAAKVCELVF